MKKAIFVAVLMAMVGAFSVAAIAQNKSREESLNEIAALTKTKKPEDQAKAYELGKEYLKRFGSEKDKGTKQVAAFVDHYREESFYKAVDNKKLDEAFSLGNELLAENPNNVTVLMNLAYTGFNGLAVGNSKYSAESIKASDKAIELILAGKGPANYAPFSDKNMALAWLNYINAMISQTTNLKLAAAHMYQALQYPSEIKDNVDPYHFIAFYYEESYTAAEEALGKKVAAKTISDAERKTEEDNINKILDFALDAYARAIKVADTTKNTKATELRKRLTQILKFRKGTDAGMEDFIKFTANSPMPDPAKQ